MGSYQEHALDGASAVDLVVALYDGILRFLYAAAEAAERGDEAGRWTSSSTCRRGCAWTWAEGRPRRSASSTPRSSRRFCRPRSRLQDRSSSTPSSASAMCATPGARWRETPPSIRLRCKWRDSDRVAGQGARRAPTTTGIPLLPRTGTLERAVPKVEACFGFAFDDGVAPS